MHPAGRDELEAGKGEGPGLRDAWQAAAGMEADIPGACRMSLPDVLWQGIIGQWPACHHKEGFLMLSSI